MHLTRHLMTSSIDLGRPWTDFVQAMANDVVQLLLIYFGRSDGDMERKDKMKKALLNFKPIKEVNLDALMEYYKINL